MQAPYDARALANYVLDKADELGFAISNMHINKIIYFTHGHFLSGKKKALVDQPFEAWEYGPVIQDLYHRFKKFGKDAITERAMILDKAQGTYVVARCKLDAEDVSFLNDLIDFYVRIPASRLSDMSHQPGGPWDSVWNYEGKSNPGMFIADGLIADWFSKKEAGKGA